MEACIRVKAQCNEQMRIYHVDCVLMQALLIINIVCTFADTDFLIFNGVG